MATRRPLIISGGALTEVPSGDAIPISVGGTGAITASAAREALGAGTSNFSGNYSDLIGIPDSESFNVRSFFARLFGSGADGDLVLTANIDHGHNNVGLKQYKNLTIPSGFNLTNLAGNNGGAIIIAVSDTLTIVGGVLANGGDATNASSSYLSSPGAGSGGSKIGGLTPVPVYGSWAYSDQKDASAIIVGHSSSGGRSICLYRTSGGSGELGYPTQQQMVDRSIQVGPNDFIRMSGSPYPVSLALASRLSGLPYSQLPPRSIQLGASLNYLFSPSCMIGSGGGCGGGAWDNGGSGLVCSGAGGGGGGIVYIEARHIDFSAGHRIEAKGGRGGNAFYSGGGGAAGGTGGNGGRVVMLCRSFSGVPNVDVSGGSAGLNAGAGVNGQTGFPGEYGVITV